MARLLKIIAVNVIVTAALVECVGVILYAVRHDAFFYADERLSPVSPGVQRSPDHHGAPGDLSTHVLHPYFGYIIRPSVPVTRIATPERRNEMLFGAGSPDPEWLDLRANNFGFFSRSDYPYARQTDEYVIGIFGGSVAQWFALQGSERLVEVLNKAQFAPGKRITVLNFSQGGYKQPQQLQALAYFLANGQQFDAVVNIDGHNEVGISGLNLERNVDASMPGAQFLLPLHKLIARSEITDSLLGLLAEEKRLQSAQSEYERMASHAMFSAVHVVAEILGEKARAARSQVILEIDAEFTRPDETSSGYVNVTPPAGGMDSSAMLAGVIELWRSSATLMQALCDASGIEYLEIVQPNQYYSGKTFTADERTVAIAADSRYRSIVESTYPGLESLATTLRGKGVNFVSAIPIFDAIQEKIYSDTCCHYNQTGNELLAEFVASELLKTNNGEQTTSTE